MCPQEERVALERGREPHQHAAERALLPTATRRELCPHPARIVQQPVITSGHGHVPHLLQAVAVPEQALPPPKGNAANAPGFA
jgi:hypothetical protein